MGKGKGREGSAHLVLVGGLWAAGWYQAMALEITTILTDEFRLPEEIYMNSSGMDSRKG